MYSRTIELQNVMHFASDILVTMLPVSVHLPPHHQHYTKVGVFRLPDNEALRRNHKSEEQTKVDINLTN